jgi:antitoxin component of MazEF toxin-antitoxin module
MGKHAKIMEGTVLNLAVSHGKVVATPVQQKKLSLSELLAKVNKKNLQDEVDFGPSVGREIW